MPRVLVVDDSKTNLMLARILLEQAGYDVLEAIDGAGCLEIAQRESPDCVILDLNLPGESGQDILRSMKEQGISIPVVVSSASIDEATQAECMQLGAAAVMNKPDGSQELDQLIKQVLGG